MADNFNLRQFLIENKLTKNAQLLNENTSGNQISKLGYEALGQSTDPGIQKLLADLKASTSRDYDECDKSPECRNMMAQSTNFNPQSDRSQAIEAQLIKLAAEKGIDTKQQAPPATPEEEAKALGFWDKVKSKVGLKEGSDYGYEALIDVVDTEYNGDPAILAAVEDAFHRGDIDTSEFGDNPSAPSQAVAQIANGMDIEAAQQSMDFEEGVEEKEAIQETLTAKERRLVEMVQNALGIAPQAVAEEAPMADDEMVQENPLPKYKNIDELMSSIEHGTNEAAHKYKMERMKEVAEALESKVTSLEEGENAEHIDQKAVKQMRKDILALRKGEEKLRKEFEKKFANKKEAKEDK